MLLETQELFEGMDESEKETIRTKMEQKIRLDFQQKARERSAKKENAILEKQHRARKARKKKQKLKKLKRN